MLQGYNESHLMPSFCKFYGRYNDLVCYYKLSLVCFIVFVRLVSILTFTMDNPVFLISTIKGCDRSAEYAYSDVTAGVAR
jgi:hypothetical protein